MVCSTVMQMSLWKLVCHSDFTWNQFGWFQKVKNCHFNHFGGFQFWFFFSKIDKSPIEMKKRWSFLTYLCSSAGSKLFFSVTASAEIYSVGNTQIFCHWVFTWNQSCQRIYIFKSTFFTNLEALNFEFVALFGGWNLPK